MRKKTLYSLMQVKFHPINGLHLRSEGMLTKKGRMIAHPA